MVKSSEVILLSDRVILNIITDSPHELTEKMKSFLEANENIFPISGRTMLITEEQGIELDRDFFKVLYKTPLLTITVSNGDVGVEFVSIQVNQEEVFNLI